MRESILAMIRRNYESGERALEIQSKNLCINFPE